jgi:dCTP deaminase
VALPKEDKFGMQRGILSDREIAALCAGERPLLDPFVPHQEGKPSYGLGSFGYDIRLGGRILVSAAATDEVLDPRNMRADRFSSIRVGEAYDLPGRTCVLGESVEWFNLPDDIIALCWGKSSYARCGLLVNVTPLEPGWRGILTLSLANLSSSVIRLHVGQGIAQSVFFRGERPQRTYGEKEAGGGYQDQAGATLPQ